MNPNNIRNDQQSCSKILVEYCDSSGLQGFKYLTEKKRSIPERIFWIIFILLSVSLCVTISCQILINYKNSPIITVLSEKEFSIHSIPFPAITICSVSKADRLYFNLNDVLQLYLDNVSWTEYYDTEEKWNVDKQKLFDFMVLCDSIDSSKDGKEKKKMFQDESLYKMLRNKNISSSLNVSIEIQSRIYKTAVKPIMTYGAETRPMTSTIKHMLEKSEKKVFRKITPIYEFFTERCLWLNEYVACSDIFTQTITEEGICLSFNILAKSDMFPEATTLPHSYFYDVNLTSTWASEALNYKSMNLSENYPRSAGFKGKGDSLSIVLGSFLGSHEYICRRGLQGYFVTVHNPLNVPQPSKYSIRVDANQRTILGIDPLLTVTSESVRKYSPEVRKCFFKDEKILKYFKFYTQSNCYLECLSDYMVKKCGCVKFFLPRSHKIKICGRGNMECTKMAEYQLKSEKLRNRLDANKNQICDCKPPCTELEYGVEVSQSPLNVFAQGRLKSNGAIAFVYGSVFEISELTIYFKTERFLAYQRQEMYEIFDLISNIGSLMSLFLGFTMMCLAEILYFFCFKIVFK